MPALIALARRGVALMKGGLARGRTTSAACCCGGEGPCIHRAVACDGSGAVIWVRTNCGFVEVGGRRYAVDLTCCYALCPDAARNSGACVPRGATVIDAPVCSPPCFEGGPSTCGCTQNPLYNTSQCVTGPRTCCRSLYDLEEWLDVVYTMPSDHPACWRDPYPVCRESSIVTRKHRITRFCGPNQPGFSSGTRLLDYSFRQTIWRGENCTRPTETVERMGPTGLFGFDFLWAPEPFGDGLFQAFADRCSGPANYDNGPGCAEVLSQSQAHNCGGGLISQHVRYWLSQASGCAAPRVALCQEVRINYRYRYIPVTDCDPPCPVYPPPPPGDPAACGTDPGACCFDDGHCEDTTRASCLLRGGRWNGCCTSCARMRCPAVPPPPPTGACCLPSGACTPGITEAACALLSGNWGEGLNCAQVNCGPPPVTGACCLPDGSCTMIDSLGCFGLNGIYRGDGTDCGQTQCPPPGDQHPCCNAGGHGFCRCTMETAQSCAALVGCDGPDSHGVWFPNVATCTDLDCNGALTGGSRSFL